MSIDKLIAYSAGVFSDRKSGQSNLFGSSAEAIPKPKLDISEDWSIAERLGEEYQAVGFYLSGHPVNQYQEYFKENEISWDWWDENQSVEGLPMLPLKGAHQLRNAAGVLELIATMGCSIDTNVVKKSIRKG